MPAPRVLIVDDQQSIRRTLPEILEYEKFEVRQAANGDLASVESQKRAFDVVLLDIKMPKMDGLQVISHCVETGTEFSVIMISGYADIKSASKQLSMPLFISLKNLLICNIFLSRFARFGAG